MMREAAERRLCNFAQLSWHVIEPGHQFVEGWHIDCVCEHLEAVSAGQIRKLLINMPPRHMKSTLVSVCWPLWHWVKVNPFTAWMFASYAYNIAAKDADKCREIFQSPWWRMLWGDRLHIDPKRKNLGKFYNNRRGYRLTTSVGSMATGEGGDIIVADDPNNVRKSESKVDRDTVNTWWDRSMSTRGNDPDTSVRVVVQQRTNEEDLTGHCKEKGGYVELILPARFEPKCIVPMWGGLFDIRKEEGAELWPQRYHKKALDELEKDMDPFAVAGQMQQQPAPSGGIIFAKENFRTAVYLPTMNEQEEQRFKQTYGGRLNTLQGVFILKDDEGRERRFLAADCWWYQCADTAMKVKEANDYTVVATACNTPEWDLIFFDVLRAKIPVPQQYGMIVEQKVRHPYVLYQSIEDKSSGTGLIQTGDFDGHNFRTLNADGDKVRRAQPLATLIQNHKVFFLAGGIWRNDLEAELIVFNRGAHDDQVDACGYCAIDMIERRGKMPRLRTIPPPTPERQKQLNAQAQTAASLSLR